MSQKTFGTHKNDVAAQERRNHVAELYKEVGVEGFPVQITISKDGELVGATFDTEWREGGTKAVEKKNGEIDYKEKYTNKKLTDAQIKKAEKWLTENVKVAE